MALLCRPAAAQGQINDPLLRFVLPPMGKLNGTVRFTVGVGRPMRFFMDKAVSDKVVVRVLRDNQKIEDVPFDQLPNVFKWDTTSFPDGTYHLQVIYQPKTGGELRGDTIRAIVANGAPLIVEKPTVVVKTPTPKLDRAIFSGRLQGIINASLEDWPADTPNTLVPIIRIYRGSVSPANLKYSVYGFRDAKTGEERVTWDTSTLINGSYLVQMSVIDLNSAVEPQTDQMMVTISNTAPPGLAPLPPRDQWKTPYPLGGTNKDKFDWVENTARQCGDPHPEVSAAQFALESGWGKSESGVNNCFGIKAQSWEDGTARYTQDYNKATGQMETVVARFKNYASPEDCVRERCQVFLRKPRYAKYWTAQGSKAAINALIEGGYCDTPTYIADIVDILGRMNRLR